MRTLTTAVAPTKRRRPRFLTGQERKVRGAEIEKFASEREISRINPGNQSESFCNQQLVNIQKSIGKVFDRENGRRPEISADFRTFRECDPFLASELQMSRTHSGASVATARGGLGLAHYASGQPRTRPARIFWLGGKNAAKISWKLICRRPISASWSRRHWAEDRERTGCRDYGAPILNFAGQLFLRLIRGHFVGKYRLRWRQEPVHKLICTRHFSRKIITNV
ncbi:MAG: hypothetical protein KGS61_03810 [Verrucomicrobia bacterium]|nr:hypothetical protein [Verrucomicrobiota bacterium]